MGEIGDVEFPKRIRRMQGFRVVKFRKESKPCSQFMARKFGGRVRRGDRKIQKEGSDVAVVFLDQSRAFAECKKKLRLIRLNIKPVTLASSLEYPVQLCC